MATSMACSMANLSDKRVGVAQVFRSTVVSVVFMSVWGREGGGGEEGGDRAEEEREEERGDRAEEEREEEIGRSRRRRKRGRKRGRREGWVEERWHI